MRDGLTDFSDRREDEHRRAYAALFGDGSENRLHLEWARYCRECRCLQTVSAFNLDANSVSEMKTELEVPKCAKLGVEIPREELDRKEKRTDCPLGTDENAFYVRRKKEIAEDRKEHAWRMFENELNEAWPEFKDRIAAAVRKKSAEAV